MHIRLQESTPDTVIIHKYINLKAQAYTAQCNICNSHPSKLNKEFPKDQVNMQPLQHIDYNMV